MRQRVLGLPMYSGIYMIKNLITGQSYIGSATFLRSRANAHRCNLINNKHANIKLQRSFNKYGQAAFIIGVIEFCPISKLIEAESRLCSLYRPYFNIRQITASNRGIKLSDETKSKMRDAHIGKTAHPNSTLAAIAANKKRKGRLSEKTKDALKLGPQSMIGKPQSEHTKELIRKSKIGKRFNKLSRKYECS